MYVDLGLSAKAQVKNRDIFTTYGRTSDICKFESTLKDWYKTVKKGGVGTHIYVLYMCPDLDSYIRQFNKVILKGKIIIKNGQLFS